MTTPMLLVYPGEEELGARLQRALPADPVSFELRRFPDRESYIRIDSSVQGRPVIVLSTLSDPDSRAMPLLFLADTLRELGATAVGLLAPYLAYMRQDRRFRTGEALTSASFARLLSGHFDWLVTVDPHLHRLKSLAEIYTIPTRVVHAAPLLAQWIRGNVEAALLIGPDAESEQWVRAVAAAIPAPHLVLQKVRQGDRDVTVSRVPGIERWAGYTPVLVDDIISSASTLIETVGLCVAEGLAPPVCVGVHGVFASGAYESLLDAGAARVVTTNSIPHTSSAIDLGPALVDSLREMLRATPG